MAIINGTPGNDTLTGTGGNDTVNGVGGDDTLHGGAGTDILNGGDNNDTLYGEDDNDTLYGGYGDDVAYGGAGADTISGIDGVDILYGEDGNDRIEGGGGDDTLYGGAGVDVMWGGTDQDTMYGGAGGDRLNGDLGHDALYGGDGNDTLSGNAGDDRLEGGLGNDTLEGAAGIDTASWRDAAVGVTVLLANSGVSLAQLGAETDTLTQVENLEGSDHADVMGGNNLANVIRGYDGADQLSGYDGDDQLQGGGGDDTIAGGDGFDTLAGGAGADDITGGVGADSLSGDDDADELDGGDGNDALNGGAGDDTLVGGAGSDNIEGGLGDDLVIFDGAVRDYSYTYVAGVLTLVDQRAGSAGATDVLTNVEYVQFADSAPISLADVIATPVVAADDVLIVTAGTASSLDAHTLILNDQANLTSYVSGVSNVVGATVSLVDGRLVITAAGGGPASFDYTIAGVNGGDVGHVDIQTNTLTNAVDVYTAPAVDAVDIHGLNGNDTLTGGTGWDRLVGGGGHDILDGGLGRDTMVGGLGNDTYAVDNAGDVIIELAGEGTDTVNAIVDYVLGDGIERLYLLGSARRGTGNALSNTIYGGTGDDFLDGGGGADFLYGGDGDDTFMIDDVADSPRDTGGVDTIRTTLDSYTLTAIFENLVYAGTGNFTGTGNSKVNHIVGGDGNDWLDSGGGADTLEGGEGSDSYVINNAMTTIIEALASSGTNTLYTSVSYILPETTNLQVLTAIGTAKVNLTGSSRQQTIHGNDSNNILDSGGGGDEMFGHGGDDIYLLRVLGDRANETGGGGYDLVRVYFENYVMALDIEKVQLMTGVNNASGNAQDNLMVGNELNNVLDGRGGADIMQGGAGYDTYYVDNPGDVIQDSSGGGYVYSRASSFTLGAGITGGTLLAAGTLIGNSLNNTLQGTEDMDVLTGGGGDDVLIGDLSEYDPFSPPSDDILDGGDGNDTLYGMDSSDSLSGGAGNDSLNGGFGGDGLSGGDGNDYLNGGSDGDGMDGGLGDDTYVVDDESDICAEAAGEGHDTINIVDGMFLVQNYTMSANIEDMNFYAYGDFTGTGNALNNVIWSGSYGSDTLRGMGGDDVLTGSWGADTLVGGTGSDTFRYEFIDQSEVGAGRDVIQDFEAGEIIDLGTVDADSATAGDQAFTFIGTSAFSNVAGQIRYEIDGAGTHVFADDDGDGVADFEVLLIGSVTLTAGNFLL